MNWDIVKGNWKQWSGEMRKQWGKLTDDDLDVIQGDRMKLAGLLQERYGRAKDEVERDIADFERFMRGADTGAAVGMKP